MDAFFVLSGLLMSRAYQKIQSSSIKERYGVFLLRRLCRIWPMVCAAVLASMVFAATGLATFFATFFHCSLLLHRAQKKGMDVRCVLFHDSFQEFGTVRVSEAIRKVLT